MDLPARRIGLLAIAAGLAAALSATGARIVRRRRRRRGRATPEPYTCTCGAVYRVTGIDRHRVYWPAGADAREPVLGDRCPACDALLPAGHETPAA